MKYYQVNISNEKFDTKSLYGEVYALLVNGELYTEKEYNELKNHSNFTEKDFNIIECNKNDTLWYFGARFPKILFQNI